MQSDGESMSSAENRFLTFITSSDNKYSYLRCLFIALLGLLVYSNTFNSPFSFDDAANLQKNPMITEFGLTGFKQAFGSRRAIGIISFQLNYFLSEWSLLSFHLTNLLIHISSALIVYHLIKMLMETPYVERYADKEFRYLPTPFFTALFFVVHPVQTQAVTYVVQRFSSLATLFYLASVAAYLKARFSQLASGRLMPMGALIWGLASLGLCFLALFTKEIAYTLPAAISMIEILFFGSSLRKIICLIVGGFAALSGVFIKFTLSAGSINSAVSVLDIATRQQTNSLVSRSDYLFTQFRVIMTYIRLIFLPLNQKIEYDYPLLRSFSDWRVFCSFVLVVILLCGAVWLIIKSRNSFPHLRFIAFGILWFFLGLSIESSIIPIIDLIFEHRLYLPSFGAFTAVSTVMLMTTKGKNNNIRNRLFEGFLLIAFLLALVAWKRNLVWKSEVSLWKDTTSKSPNSARGWNNLAGAYIKEREAQNALKAAVRSIELDPSHADAWNNLGIAIDLHGVYNDRFNRTSEMFIDSSAVEDKIVKKWLGDVNNNLGLAYEILGNFSKAAENYHNAIGYNPALGLAYYNLGILSAKIGDFPNYAEQQQILWMIDPFLAERLKARVGKR
jgi:protein O-mannosyl-transferase